MRLRSLQLHPVVLGKGIRPVAASAAAFFEITICDLKAEAALSIITSLGAFASCKLDVFLAIGRKLQSAGARFRNIRAATIPTHRNPIIWMNM